MNYFLECLRKYAVFSGRARRKEFWTFTFIIIMIVIIEHLFNSPTIKIFASICYLFLIVPFIAVSVRRLHDTNHNGLLYFINLIPVIGQIIFFILMLQDSQLIDNRYGPSPKKANI